MPPGLYQPVEKLSAALSAADLHVVVMGNPFVGTIHPCKIYNILRVAAPVLYIGPSPSHVTQILQPEGKVSGNAQNYTLVNHGEVERTPGFPA